MKKVISMVLMFVMVFSIGVSGIEPVTASDIEVNDRIINEDEIEDEQLNYENNLIEEDNEDEPLGLNEDSVISNEDNLDSKDNTQIEDNIEDEEPKYLEVEKHWTDCNILYQPILLPGTISQQDTKEPIAWIDGKMFYKETNDWLVNTWLLSDEKIPVDKVEVRLYVDKQPTDEVIELSSSGNWKGRFELKPEYFDEDGKLKVRLDVIENNVTNITFEDDNSSNGNLLIGNEQFQYLSILDKYNNEITIFNSKTVCEPRYLEVEKKWMDCNFKYEYYDNITIDSGNPPVIDDGSGITMWTTAVESFSESSSSLTENQINGYDVSGNELSDFEIPVDSVMVRLYIDGKPTDQVIELNRANNWKGKFKLSPDDFWESGDLRENVTVVEENAQNKNMDTFWQAEGDVLIGNEEFKFISLTNSYYVKATIFNYQEVCTEKINIPIEKVWLDKDGQIEEDETKHPAEVVVILKNEGKEVNRKVLNKDNNWKDSFENLPKYKNKEEVKYTIEEVKIDGFESNIELNDETDISSGYKITNKAVKITPPKDSPQEPEVETPPSNSPQEPEVETPPSTSPQEPEVETPPSTSPQEPEVETPPSTSPQKPDKSVFIDIKGEKIWLGDTESSRPESIVLVLYKNGVEIEAKKVTALDSWKYDFGKHILIEENGKENDYNIKEMGIEGYTVTYDGFDVINQKETILKPELTVPSAPNLSTRPSPVDPTSPLAVPSIPSKPIISTPEEVLEPTKPNVVSSRNKKKTIIPKTGDDNKIFIYSGILLLAIALLIKATYKRVRGKLQ